MDVAGICKTLNGSEGGHVTRVKRMSLILISFTVQLSWMIHFRISGHWWGLCDLQTTSFEIPWFLGIYTYISIYIHYIETNYVYYHILILHITYILPQPPKRRIYRIPKSSIRAVEWRFLPWGHGLFSCVHVRFHVLRGFLLLGVVCIPGPKTVKKPSNCQIKVLFKLFWRFPSPNVCNYK